MEFSASVALYAYDVDGVQHISFQVWTSEPTAEETQDAAECAMKVLRGDRRTFVRVVPEVCSQRNIDRDCMEHAGYARFVVLPEIKGDAEVLPRSEIAPIGLMGGGEHPVSTAADGAAA